ncbi:MAG: PHP domain-containing protein [Clostridia bacterium]|nr:PHP domain-containing protein [Clostridia bacterium]
MRKYYYDLHVHSCLSPCGDNDMTVNNIAGMGKIAGLQIMALTDHNSVKNLPSFFVACENYGITPIGGMELTTAEDIHMICLFPSLENAMRFGEEVEKRRIKIKNKPEIFGEQLILDEQDNIIGNEEYLLINATSLSLEEGYELSRSFGGIAYPAHIDRDANGIIAVLGDFPESPKFTCAELHNIKNEEEYKKKFPILCNKKIICCSDAHYLDKIPDAKNYFELEDNLSNEEIRKNIIEFLKD